MDLFGPVNIMSIGKRNTASLLLMILQDFHGLSFYIPRMKKVKSSLITLKLLTMEPSGELKRSGVIMVLSLKIPQ